MENDWKNIKEALNSTYQEFLSHKKHHLYWNPKHDSRKDFVHESYLTGNDDNYRVNNVYLNQVFD